MAKIFKIAGLVLICCNMCAGISLAAEQVNTSDEKEPELTKEQRIFGLVTIYQTAKQHFAYFEQVPELDWDKAFMEYLPLVEKQQSLLEYYRTLQRFIALLEDGHTNVYLPKTIKDQLDNLPLKLEYIRNEWVVAERMPTKEILREDIPVGSIVCTIEGLPTNEYIEKNFFPYLAHGTIQGKRTAVNWKSFFQNGQEVEMTFKYPDGSLHSRTVRANRKTIKWNNEFYKKYVSSLRFGPGFSTKKLDGDILYVRYRQCTNQIQQKICKLIQDMKIAPKSMIIDLRGNGGGNTPHKAISHLISEPIKTSRSKTRCSISAADASLTHQTIKINISQQEEMAKQIKESIQRGDLPKGYSPGWLSSDENEKSMDNYVEPHDKHYDGPLVMLVDAETGSAAEGFVVALHGNHRATVIGQPTSGSTGTPFYFNLPGGGRGRICTINRSYPDGRQFVGVGIQPDVSVKRTIKAIAEGRDEILEAAIEYLNSVKDAQKAKGK